MTQFLLWGLLVLWGNGTSGAVPRGRPGVKVACPKLNTRKVQELFHMEVDLHRRSLPLLQQKQIPDLILRITCDVNSFIVDITHRFTKGTAQRKFAYPQISVDPEPVVALAAVQMLWADLKKRAYRIRLQLAHPLMVTKKKPPISSKSKHRKLKPEKVSGSHLKVHHGERHSARARLVSGHSWEIGAGVERIHLIDGRPLSLTHIPLKISRRVTSLFSLSMGIGVMDGNLSYEIGDVHVLVSDLNAGAEVALPLYSGLVLRAGLFGGCQL